MSRNRYDRDDRDYYGEGSRAGGGGGGEDRYGSERGGYGGGLGRGSGPLDRDYGSEDSYRSRSFSRGGGGGGAPRSYGRDDYGRGGGYMERDDYGADERRYSGYSETSGGGGHRRSPRSDYDRGEDRRSWFEDERDDRRETERSRGGASRSHVRCRDIMTRDVTVATRDTTLQEVASMMRDEDTGVIPVVDREGASDNSGADAQQNRSSRARSNGRLVGLVTDRDIVIRALAEEKDARTTRVEEVMTTDVHTAQPNDRVIEVIRKMGDKQVRRIPVVDENNNLRGIISMADVALETEEDRELADALEEISSGSSFWSKIFG